MLPLETLEQYAQENEDAAVFHAKAAQRWEELGVASMVRFEWELVRDLHRYAQRWRRLAAVRRGHHVPGCPVGRAATGVRS